MEWFEFDGVHYRKVMAVTVTKYEEDYTEEWFVIWKDTDGGEHTLKVGDEDDADRRIFDITH